LTPRDRGRERYGEPGRGAVVQRPLLDLSQVSPPNFPVGAFVKSVELQVNADRPAVAAVALAERVGERLVGGQPDAVRIEGDVADRAGLGGIDEAENVLVDGGFPAGEHHHLRLTLRSDEHVQHLLALLRRDRVPVGLVTRIGETDGAVQVAVRVYLDDAQAGMLLVLRAQPAV
jgi:hypothetical protein